MNEQEIKKLFKLPLLELAKELAELVSFEREKDTKKLFKKYWMKLSISGMIIVLEEIERLEKNKLEEYRKEHGWILEERE